MKPFSTIVGLLFTFAVFSVAEDCDPDAPYFVKPYDGETTTDSALTSRLVDYWSQSKCFMHSDDSEPSIKQQCKDVCLPGGDDGKGGAVLSSSTCNFGNSPWFDGSTGKPLLCGTDKNFAGRMMKIGYCTCDSPIIEILGDFFVEGVKEAGKILEKVVCPALQALDVVMAVGMAAIPPPGKAITGGMIAAAKSAKAYKYAYEAQDAAQEWADFFLGGLSFADQAGCGSLIKLPSKDDLIKRAFGPLSDAPDDVIPGGMNYESLPCPAKGCRGCKGPKCRNDNGNDNHGESKTDARPSPTTTNSQPEQTHETPKTTQPPPKSSSSSTSLISSAIPTSTLGCKGLAARYTYEESSEVERRTRSYPIDVQLHRLQKRAAPKNAKACDFDLKSFRYPSSGEWKSLPKRYGFNIMNSCDNYDWGNADTGSKVKYESEHVLEWQLVAGFFTQMGDEITRDFDHPNPEIKTKVKFCEYWVESWNFDSKQLIDNPLQAMPVASSPGPGVTPSIGSDHASRSTPASGLQSSSGPEIATGSTPVHMPIPNSVLISSSGSKSVSGSTPVAIQTPRVTPGGSGIQKRTPFHWLASQYPYTNKAGGMWLEEMPLLEKAMNGQNKEKIFTRRKNKHGELIAIRDVEMLTQLAEGEYKNPKTQSKDAPSDQAITLIKYVREMIGVFIYMQEDDVAEIFAIEKHRMGAIIGAIDKELHKTPRKKLDPTTNKLITYNSWQEQGLGDRWNSYMDDSFERAKKRGTDYVKVNLDKLGQEWNSQKKRDEFKIDRKDDAKRKAEKRELEKTHRQILNLLEKTRKEWDKVKDWKKPKQW